MKRDKTLSSLYSCPGFKASSQLEGTFRDPQARIVVLQRRKKVVRSVQVAGCELKGVMTGRQNMFGMSMREGDVSIYDMSDGAFIVQNARRCMWSD
ncbi:MAG: hypothetical protein ABIE74_04270 [Pseudomonadota bacterium]